jgi:hypothetical protein
MPRKSELCHKVTVLFGNQTSSANSFATFLIEFYDIFINT